MEAMKVLFYWVLYPLIRPLYLVSVIFNTLVLGIIVIFISLFDSRGTVVHYIGRFWSLLNICLSGTRVTLSGAEKIDRHRSYIVMSNHQSLFDVWALIGKLPLQIRWIVKKELRKIPVFGYALERMGHIYIDRADRNDSYAGLNEAARRVKGGTSVIIFPEGTRSKDGRLLRFRLGGAVIALRSGVSILPVTVNGGRFVLRKGTLDLLPGKMEIIIGEEIDPAAFEENDREALMEAVKSAIEKNLNLSYGKIP
jgi:1-acyl-sn-glycerol-3-phosphate acyltransferase